MAEEVAKEEVVSKPVVKKDAPKAAPPAPKKAVSSSSDWSDKGFASEERYKIFQRKFN